jgi:hypothetical protein
MLAQLVTGGVAGLLLLFRMYWRRAKGAILRKPAASPDRSASSLPDDAT